MNVAFKTSSLFSLPCSTLGRIIRLTQEVIDYREWIIKKWGGRDLARTDNRGMIHTLFHSNEEKVRLYEDNMRELI